MLSSIRQPQHWTLTILRALRHWSQQLVAGIAILGATSVLMGVLFVAGFAFYAPVLVFAQYPLWFLVVLGMLLWGVHRSKPGYVAAPFIFFALWIGVSLVSRIALTTQIDPRVWAAPVAPEARAQRTLIVKSDVPVARRIIDGDVDKLVAIHIHYNSVGIPEGSHIEEITLAKGDACSSAEMRASGQLHRAGRIDECFKWRDLDSIPDGLIVQRVASSIPHCNETQARLREHDQERVLFSWFQCESFVFSYIPVFGSYRAPTSIWGFDGGPTHVVRYGQRDIGPKTMIHAIYQVPATRRLDDPDKPWLSAQAEVADIVADMIPIRPRSDQ